MTSLRSALSRYVGMRQGFGYKFQKQARLLANFVSFMEEQKATTITVKVALDWATQPTDRHASWVSRLAAVRGFARHVAHIDPATEVPRAGILPCLKRSQPYIYSDAQVEALLKAALTLPPANGLQCLTYHCLFGLLAVTGIRVSEAIALECADVDLREGLLTIRESKFGKSRYVPLHPMTQVILRRYAKRRDAHFGSRCGTRFFVAVRGGRLHYSCVHAVFLRLSREIGLRGPSDVSGPRIHDLRHRFAVHTLLEWYRGGANIDQQLPVLSTFLGHTCVGHTYWYLSACPELMEEAARRLDGRWEAKP